MTAREPSWPTAWQAVAILFAVVAFTVLVDCLVIALVLFASGRPVDAAFDDPVVILLVAFSSQIAILLAIDAVIRRRGLPAGEALACRPVALGTLVAATAGVLVFSQLGDFVVHLIQQRWPELPSALDSIGDAVRALPRPALVLAALGLAIFPALGEEGLCRGLLFTCLERTWGGPAAVLTTALLFGLLHLDPLQTPAALIAGVYLGLVRWRSGSVYPGVLAHAANNLIATVLFVAQPSPPAWLVSGRATLVCALVGLLLLPFVRRREP